MKVLYYCPSEGMYGDNIALLNIIPILIEKGVTPYFIVVEHECPFVDFLKKCNYTYYVIPCRMWQMIDHKYYIYNWISKAFSEIREKPIYKEYLKQAKKIVDNIKPDIIHSNSSNSRFGYELANLCSIPHVWHLREYGLFDSNKHFFPSKSFFISKLRKNNHNIAITPQISEYYGSLRNTETIYDGVVDENLPLPIIKKKKKQFLFCGRLFEKKGIESVIRAFASVHKIDLDFCLLIAGRGQEAYERYLKNIVINLGIHEKVYFLGYRSDVFSLMSESKAFVMSSDFEAFGFTTSEAMYNGTLIIGRDTGGSKLQMDNADHYYGSDICLRYNNQDELEKCMAIIMKFDDVAVRYSAFQQCVAELYGIRRSSKSVYECYNSVLLSKY